MLSTLSHSGRRLSRFAVSARCCSSSSVLRDKTALVTGSTSGIGLSIAELLASRGCRVVITGFGDQKAALNQVQQSASTPSDVVFIDPDLSSKDESVRLVHDSVNAFNAQRLDIVVNNAGFQHISKIEDFDDAKYLSLMDLMLHSPFFITKAVIPYMRRNGYGRIINLASAHGLRASPFKGPYCVAKHGLV